ncbi:hypothetical protein [Natrononativus amylolyticus]|uniref:hypothetical protein n=1 Tax=Natrononativus amylolyticus TaxID=2963434 RepID=UPI0020CE2A5C|nr:hypothetical protein [Natrononativus amylolyticus]
MTEKSPEERRRRASEYNLGAATYKPRQFVDELREAGLAFGLIIVAAGLFLVVDGLVTYGILTAALGVVMIGIAAFVTVPRTERRLMHIQHTGEDTLRFDLEVFEHEHEAPRASHEYELPAGERAVYPDSYEPDTSYTISVALEGGEEMRTTATPVRSSADTPAGFAVEIDRTGVRTRRWTAEDGDATAGTPHELFLQ